MFVKVSILRIDLEVTELLPTSHGKHKGEPCTNRLINIKYL